MSDRNKRGLFLRNGVWHIDKQMRRTRICQSTHTGDRQKAEAVLARIVELAEQREADECWEAHVEKLAENRSSWLYETLERAARRSRHTGKGCTLTAEQLKLLLLQSGGRCSITGIPFCDKKPNGARHAPFAMSLDRIESSQGYHVDNVRIVCLAVNLAMGQWGLDVLVLIGKATMLKELQKDVLNGNFDIDSRKTPAANFYIVKTSVSA